MASSLIISGQWPKLLEETKEVIFSYFYNLKILLMRRRRHGMLDCSEFLIHVSSKVNYPRPARSIYPGERAWRNTPNHG